MQAWIFHRFQALGSKEHWEGYMEDLHPQTRLYVPSKGDRFAAKTRAYLDHIDLGMVEMHPYLDHRQTVVLDPICLYSGWLRSGRHMVRYLPERVLRQFGYVQTIHRHPSEYADPLMPRHALALRYVHCLIMC